MYTALYILLIYTVSLRMGPINQLWLLWEGEWEREGEGRGEGQRKRKGYTRRLRHYISVCFTYTTLQVLFCHKYIQNDMHILYCT